MLRRVLPVLGLAVAGGVVLLAAGDSLVAAIGIFLFGAAGVLAVAFVFLEIDLAEDRERAATARERARVDETDPGPPRERRPPRRGDH